VLWNGQTKSKGNFGKWILKGTPRFIYIKLTSLGITSGTDRTRFGRFFNTKRGLLYLTLTCPYFQIQGRISQNNSAFKSFTLRNSSSFLLGIQDKQRTSDITVCRVRTTFLAVEEQNILHKMSVYLQIWYPP